MIGFVIVCHSAKLAEGVCELAGQAAQGKVRLAAAGGTVDATNPIGTDAFKVLRAIESVYSEDGVLVLMDLGSAVLSAETALEFLPEDKRSRVRLCSAPLVEGAVAAVSQAAAGAGLEEILREAQIALEAKVAQLSAGHAEPKPAAEPESSEPWQEALVTLTNRLGLHARPAAHLIRLARRFRAKVTVENLSAPAGPFDAASINGVLSLGARQRHQLRIRAQGTEARQALVALTNFIASGCGESESAEVTLAPVAPAPAQPAPGELIGIAASAGIAIGPLVKLRPSAIKATARTVDNPEAEWQRLQTAIRAAQEETRALYEWAKTHAGEYEAGIFDAQLLFLEDPALIGSASHSILADRLNAEFVWQSAAGKLAERLRSLEDPYLRARAVDVADVTARVLGRLTGLSNAPSLLRQPSILAAHDLAPSAAKELDPSMVLAVCLETGSATAHSVILMRAMAIPVVVGLGPGLSAIEDGTTVALDGEQGRVWVSPDAGEARGIESRREAWLRGRRVAQQERHRPAATRDGHRIHVLANLKSVDEASEALDCGTEGIGLLRTEFLFLGRETAPSEEEQLIAYRTVAEALGSRPLVIRTLDIGGDKRVPYIEMGEEANPQLGWRGIRVMLGRRDLFRTQLRAILRAGCGHPIDIMFPMICSVAELREAKVALSEVEAELEREGIPFRKCGKVGIMIEVPSAVAVADQLAREASFFSIGSNDLVQYVMAADRTNSRVAPLADPFQPAVLRMLRDTIQTGRQAGIGVCLCGELAADTLATPVLIGMGLEEFSVSAKLIPELKQAIARWTLPAAEAIARETLALDSSEVIRRFLSNALPKS
ncbi:MAG: phosphoenolpyruvate--protein phosphotransferase [Bryobacteraceae bacterium]|jgi:phosphocarrier protein FPr